MSNNLDAPVLNMLNEWNGHYIELIIIIKHCTLIDTIYLLTLNIS